MQIECSFVSIHHSPIPIPVFCLPFRGDSSPIEYPQTSLLPTTILIPKWLYLDLHIVIHVFGLKLLFFSHIPIPMKGIVLIVKIFESSMSL